MGTLPSALQRRKVEGMQRWMAFCASAKEVRLALTAWPQRQKPAEVEDLSYEKSPVFASMLRMKASKDAFADFVVAQKEAFALQALSEAELHGCHTTLDFDDMYVAAKTFAEMSKEQFRFLLSADMDLKLELVGELAPSPMLLQNRALLSDQSLQEALMKNPGKPKVAAQARQLSDIKGQLKSFTEQMAWPPETFPITPLTDAIGHTKLSVGVAFVVEKLVFCDDLPQEVEHMLKYVLDVRGQVGRKKITLPAYMSKFLENMISKAKASLEEGKAKGK